MKKIAVVLFVLVLAACKKDKEPTPADNNGLQGGKGGNINMVIFTKIAASGADARVYLKYAADKAPADSTKYDEITNTMTEPGYGFHAHFNQMKKGTYYFFTKSNKHAEMVADTVIHLTDTTASGIEFTLYMK